jgi:hypothetical protein
MSCDQCSSSETNSDNVSKSDPRDEQLSKLMKIMLSSVEKINAEKKDMINIILGSDTLSDKILLERLKLFLLKRQVKSENNDTKESQKIDYEGIFNHQKIEDMNFLSDILSTVTEPEIQYGKLIVKIGDVIRSKDLSDSEKVSEIRDLLI